MKTTTLYRPIGLKELELIIESEFSKFPPRLEWQPIFYPVMNEEYACEIALKWNTTDEFSGYLGFVTTFEVTTEYLERFEIQNVGGKIHNELWVPAEDMEKFNNNIIGPIKIINVFIGEKFKGLENKIICDKLENQNSIFKMRFETFMRTKDRTLLSFNDFNKSGDLMIDKKNNSDEKNFEELKLKAVQLNSLNEAVDFLTDEALSNNSIKEIQNQTVYAHLMDYSKHFGINMYLRNLFFYSNENVLFKNSILKEGKSFLYNNRGEFGEGIIESALWRKLNNYEKFQIKNLKEIQGIEEQIDNIVNQFFEDRGLEESALFELDSDELWEQWNNHFKINDIHEPIKKLELISYNFTNKEVENYLNLNLLKGNDYEEKLNIEAQKNKILSRINKDEEEIFNYLKDEYIRSQILIEKLRNLEEVR